MMPWCAWRRTSNTATCWWKGRATLAAWTATARRPCVIPRRASPKSPCEMLAGSREGDGGLLSRTSTRRSCSRHVSCRARFPESAGQRHWRHRGGYGYQYPARTISAETIDALLRCFDRRSRISTIPKDSWKSCPGPRFSHRRHHYGHVRHRKFGIPYGPGARGGARARGDGSEYKEGLGKSRIIITEIPYQVNKASPHREALRSSCTGEKASRASQICGMNPIKRGMRIVIELKKRRQPQRYR